MDERLLASGMVLTGKAFKNMLISQTRTASVVSPRCPHAETCGGCAFQDRAYADQVAVKSRVLGQLWAERAADFVRYDDDVPMLEIVPSPEAYAYRTRMDYVATKGRFGLRMRGRFNYVVELSTCHLIPHAAFDAALQVWQHSRKLALPDYNIRSHEGFLRYIVVRRSPQNNWLLAAVTAEGDYAAEMEQLADLALAQPGVVGFHWLLNAGLSDLSFGTPLRHWGAKTLPMQVGDYTLHIGANTFFQNNVYLLMPLLDAVREAVVAERAASSWRIADMYCGVGAIALHLAPHVQSVVGVESFAESAEMGQFNMALNGATNVTIQAADVLAFLRDQQTAQFECVVADPPRTGLGDEVCAELLRLKPRRIVYVSCNPLSQHEDLEHLLPTYRLTSLCGYDMFPHTPHVETLAVLDARHD